MSYGWLNKSLDKYGIGWSGGFGGGAASCVYDYGAPAGAGGDASAADVIMQFIFDEASGAIASTADVSDTVAVVGAPTYEVAATGDFECLSPGITTLNSLNAFAEDSLAFTDIGTSDFTLEFWYSGSVASGAYGIVISTWTLAGIDSQRFYFSHRPTNGTIEMALDNTSITKAHVTATAMDGSPHKYRVVFDRSGSVDIIWDGGSIGTAAISAEVATSILSGSFQVGGFQSFGSGTVVTYYEVRISKNLTNNSGGINGG